MARVSGNVNADGSVSSDTSNQESWSVTKQSQGKYRVTFQVPFKEVPTVLLNVINWDCEGDGNQINIGIVPNLNYFDVEFWRNNTYSNQSFSFGAFGAN